MITLCPTSYCYDEYVDFTDMGSYDHGLQINKPGDYKDYRENIVPVENQPEAAMTEKGGPTLENGSRPMKFLQRVVKSILRQMNVQAHAFGPGEAITIDLQAEIHYDHYVTLNKFVNAESPEEADKQLNKVDYIMSNIIHVVAHEGSKFEWLETVANLPIFNSVKFWLVVMTLSVVCFMIVTLSFRAVYAPSNASMLLYGFLIIFILSCIWTFSHMYEDAKATNYAKLIQTKNPPKDCEYENMNWRESVSYFFRVQLYGYKDQCEQYYSTSMLDPFWSVNPLEAISRSFSRLVFAPFGYIGEKLGLFLGGIIRGIPLWLQPLLVFLVFGFVFLSLFGYRVVSPLFTLEPARRPYLEHRSSNDASMSVGHAITGGTRNEIMEKPDGKLMKSIRNASTDMDGFEDFLLGRPSGRRRHARQRPKTRFHAAVEKVTLWGAALWDFVISWLQFLLVRQFPHQPDVQEEDESFNDAPQEVVQGQGQAMDNDSPPPVRIIEENIVISRRRYHVQLERSELKSEDDKENVQPCSSSSVRNEQSKDNLENDTQEDKNAPSVEVGSESQSDNVPT